MPNRTAIGRAAALIAVAASTALVITATGGASHLGSLQLGHVDTSKSRLSHRYRRAGAPGDPDRKQGGDQGRLLDREGRVRPSHGQLRRRPGRGRTPARPDGAVGVLGKVVSARSRRRLRSLMREQRRRPWRRGSGLGKPGRSPEPVRLRSRQPGAARRERGTRTAYTGAQRRQSASAVLLVPSAADVSRRQGRDRSTETTRPVSSGKFTTSTFSRRCHRRSIRPEQREGRPERLRRVGGAGRIRRRAWWARARAHRRVPARPRCGPERPGTSPNGTGVLRGRRPHRTRRGDATTAAAKPSTRTTTAPRPASASTPPPGAARSACTRPRPDRPARRRYRRLRQTTQSRRRGRPGDSVCGVEGTQRIRTASGSPARRTTARRHRGTGRAPRLRRALRRQGQDRRGPSGARHHNRGGRRFRIDHPLDPTHKYLLALLRRVAGHENVYDGAVTTDRRRYRRSAFRARSVPQPRLRYQLTPIGDLVLVRSRVKCGRLIHDPLGKTAREGLLAGDRGPSRLVRRHGHRIA